MMYNKLCQFGSVRNFQLISKHFQPNHSQPLPITALVNVTAIRTKVTKPDPDYKLNKTALSAAAQAGTGRIYDKKPFKFLCEKGKVYVWCTCGWSKTQPFCDETHKMFQYKITLKPLRFIPTETKEYLFCNCKQTSKRPFCDGTHKREDIQAAIKS